MDLIGIHLIHYIHNGEWTTLHDVVWDISWSLKRYKISCFTKTNPCPSTSHTIVFVMSNWHYVINQWCSPLVDVVITDPFELIRIHGLLFLVGCYNSHNSSEGWFLLQLVLNRHIFPSIYKSFWMFTPKVKRVFSSMCQHGVRSKRD